MNKPLVLIAAILGIVFLVLACVYWFVPAGSLPTFMPGFFESDRVFCRAPYRKHEHAKREPALEAGSSKAR